jgi:peptide deformylase
MVSAIVVPKTKLKTPPLSLHTLGDRVLRQPAKRVAKVNEEIRQLARDMLKTMYSSDGIGLAAPQVGVPKRIIVVDIAPDKEMVPPLVLINPEIKAHGEALVVGQEGCLSVPGVYCDVKRYDMIQVAFKDETGRPRLIESSGLLSRVIQHEIDHLDGVMFVDLVDNAVLLDQELRKHGFNVQDVQSKVA